MGVLEKQCYCPLKALQLGVKVNAITSEKHSF